MTLLNKSPRGLRRIFRVKIKTGLLLPPLVLFLAVGGVFAVWKMLVVRQIWVEFTSEFSNAEVIKDQLSNVLGGKPLVLLSEKEITSELQTRFPEVSNVSLTRNWPNGVTASVSSWSETLVVGVKSPFFLVNNQGLIFGITESKDSGTYLPINISSNLTIGQNIDFKNLGQLIFISDFINQEKLSGKFIEIAGNSVSLVLGQTLVFLPLDQRVALALDSFWQIYKNYQINGKAVKTIDLRFDNPVITE